MTLTQAISEINFALRGLDDTAPSSGSDEYTYWLSLLNRKKDELYFDTSKVWSEAYETRSLGTISVASAPSFNLPTDFIAPTGDGEFAGAYIIKTDGNRVDLTLLKPQEKSTEERSVYISGRNPQTLKFTDAIVTGENIVGGTLYISGTFLPADLTTGSDNLAFPDNHWACMAVASEIAFNDIVYETKAVDLNAKANALYTQMDARNNRGINGQPRLVKYNVRKIKG